MIKLSHPCLSGERDGGEREAGVVLKGLHWSDWGAGKILCITLTPESRRQIYFCYDPID